MKTAALVKMIAVSAAIAFGHLHGHPVHAGPHPPLHSAAYYAVHPCAPGHPPVPADTGVCVGTEYIPS
jgi:hypothetical protein